MGNFGTVVLDLVGSIKRKKNPTKGEREILAAYMANGGKRQFKKELLGGHGKFEGEVEEIDPKTGKKEKVLCYSFSDYSKYNPKPKTKKKNNKV